MVADDEAPARAPHASRQRADIAEHCVHEGGSGLAVWIEIGGEPVD
jgi:hypothetical protein